jgi:ornithine cyclodeaminase
MREADDALITKSRLFVDSRDTTIGHIGELVIPIAQGTITESDVLGDFYDLVTGTTARRNDDDITLFKNGGGAHMDLMTAQYLMTLA